MALTKVLSDLRSQIFQLRSNGQDRVPCSVNFLAATLTPTVCGIENLYSDAGLVDHGDAHVLLVCWLAEIEANARTCSSCANRGLICKSCRMAVHIAILLIESYSDNSPTYLTMSRGRCLT